MIPSSPGIGGLNKYLPILIERMKLLMRVHVEMRDCSETDIKQNHPISAQNSIIKKLIWSWWMLRFHNRDY